MPHDTPDVTKVSVPRILPSGKDFQLVPEYWTQDFFEPNRVTGTPDVGHLRLRCRSIIARQGAIENCVSLVPLLPVPVGEGTTLDELCEDAGSVRVAGSLVAIGEPPQEHVGGFSQCHPLMRRSPPRLAVRSRLLLEIPRRPTVIGGGIVGKPSGVGVVGRVAWTPPLAIAVCVRRTDLRRDSHQCDDSRESVQPTTKRHGVHFPRDLLARAQRSVRERGKAHQNSPGVVLTSD
jgi:hypothetical protein